MKNLSKISLETTTLMSGVILVISAYILSFFRWFTQPTLTLLGIVMFLFWAVILISRKPRLVFNPLSLVFIVFALLIFLQGFLSYPTTTDAHNYHITRAVYWLTDQTIIQKEVYTSHDFMSPLPSIANAVLYSLKGDRLLFLSQWLCFVVGVLLVGKLAALLSASKFQTHIAQGLALTIPIVLLEASSTQADLMVAMWTLVSVIYAIKFLKQKRPRDLVFVCLAVGLGILSKATMYIYAIVPFLLVFWTICNSKRKAQVLIWGTVGILLLLTLNLPHWIQNKRLFDSYLGDSYTIEGESIPFVVERYSVEGLILNLYRNIMMNVPLGGLSAEFDQMIEPIFKKLGTSFSDRTYTWYEQAFKHTSYPIPQEDIAPAPIQTMIVAMTAIFVLYKSKSSLTAWLFISTLLSFFAFSSILLWQEYHVRQQIALLFVFLPASVLLLPISKRVWKIILTIGVLSSFMVIIANTSRPLISYAQIFPYVSSVAPKGFIPPKSVLLGRTRTQLFLARPYWQVPYEQTIDTLVKAKVKRVYIQLDEGFQYPFIALAKERGIEVIKASGANVDAEVFAGMIRKYDQRQTDDCIYLTDKPQLMCIRLLQSELE